MKQRDEIFHYVRIRYGSEIEHPWLRFPDYAVFRHRDNRKWYGLVMDLPRGKLGLQGTERVDVLNVKTDSPLLADMLCERAGILPGYHMARGCWISALLDGTLPTGELFALIDRSYAVTASKQTKKTLRAVSKAAGERESDE